MSGLLRMTLSKESSNDQDPFLVVLQALVGKTKRLSECDPVTRLGLCICRLATDARSLHMEGERANTAFRKWGNSVTHFLLNF